MQKWCPEAFEATGAIRATGVKEAPPFQAEVRPAAASTDSSARAFRSEAGFTDPQMLLNHLTQRERAQLFDLVEQDLDREYEAREQELRGKLEAQTAAAEEWHRSALENLGQELERVTAARLKEMADGSARLAVRLAEKIIRSVVAVDQDVLARALEIGHYKLQESHSLSVSLHPEDAAWLEAQPELCARLKIATINSDRRLEKGGGLVRSGQQEVDATIGRQLETLTEIVEEALATAGGQDKLLPTKEDHEPELG